VCFAAQPGHAGGLVVGGQCGRLAVEGVDAGAGRGVFVGDDAVGDLRVDQCHFHFAVAEQRGDGLEPHAVDGLGGQGVPQPVGVHAGDAGGAGDDAADDIPVQRPAVVGDQSLVAAGVLEAGCGPGSHEGDELAVQRHVAVVAELAERDPEPVAGADLHDGVGFQVGELAGPHAGAGRQFDDEPVAGIAAGPGCGHEPGGVAVVEELRQRLGFWGCPRR
jgi:hypothetical protein